MARCTETGPPTSLEMHHPHDHRVVKQDEAEASPPITPDTSAKTKTLSRSHEICDAEAKAKADAAAKKNAGDVAHARKSTWCERIIAARRSRNGHLYDNPFHEGSASKLERRAIRVAHALSTRSARASPLPPSLPTLVPSPPPHSPLPAFFSSLSRPGAPPPPAWAYLEVTISCL